VPGGRFYLHFKLNPSHAQNQINPYCPQNSGYAMICLSKRSLAASVYEAVPKKRLSSNKAYHLAQKHNSNKPDEALTKSVRSSASQGQTNDSKSHRRRTLKTPVKRKNSQVSWTALLFPVLHSTKHTTHHGIRRNPFSIKERPNPWPILPTSCKSQANHQRRSGRVACEC
jgi:hypothetical protein